MQRYNINNFKSESIHPASIIYTINYEIKDNKDKHPASILDNKCLYTINKQMYIKIQNKN